MEEKDLHENGTESLSDQRKKIVSFSKFHTVILIVLCSVSITASLLTLFMINQFTSISRSSITRQQNRRFIVSHIIKQAEFKLSERDYKIAQLMVLSALKLFPDSSKLFNEYNRVINAVISNVYNPRTALRILNDGEIFIIKFISETNPSYFPNFSRILKLIRDKRSEYLKKMVNRIKKLEEEGNTDRVNFIIKNYAYAFSSSRNSVERIMDLLLKRLERFSKSKKPSLGLAYSTLEMAVALEEDFAVSTGNSTPVENYVDKMNDLVRRMEKKEIMEEVESLLVQLRVGEQLSPYMDEAALSAKIQVLLAKAQRLVNNPLVSNDEKEKIYEGMYKVQKAFQKVLRERKSGSLKRYNRWALNILEEYNQHWNTSQILYYARELGEIDTGYLFTEVNLYYNRVLSEIIGKLKNDEDIKEFIDTMFNQTKRSPSS